MTDLERLEKDPKVSWVSEDIVILLKPGWSFNPLRQQHVGRARNTVEARDMVEAAVWFVDPFAPR